MMQALSMENCKSMRRKQKTISAQPMEELKKRDGDGLRGSTKAAGLKTGTRKEDRLSLLNIAKFKGGRSRPPVQTQNHTNRHRGSSWTRQTTTNQNVWPGPKPHHCSRPVCLVAAGRGRDQPCVPQPNHLHTPPPCRPSEPNPVRRYTGSVGHQRPRAKNATVIRLSTQCSSSDKNRQPKRKLKTAEA